MTDSPNLSYQDAGVDIEKADQLVNQIKHIAKRTHRPGVMQNIGGFGALFEVPTDRFKKPVLVSGTDGVGTKLKLAIDLNCHEHIGIDLVAMCVNDILTLGAEPLFFLDYFATGKLQLEQAQTIIASIGRGCELAGAALIGGETAEMPGLYQADDYDLAGFCVGAVEKDRIIDGSKVAAGDVLIALPSSGLHANGFSLVRKVIDVSKAEVDESLLTPTRIYVKSVLALCSKIDVHAMSHITGGGLIENIPRTLPDDTVAHIDTSSWQWPEIFSWLQKAGNITTTEMQRTFNVGVGMVIAVSAEDVEQSLTILQGHGEDAWIIGKIASRKDQNEDQVKFS